MEMSDGVFLNWLGFAAVMALGQFSPGPDMILLTRVALSDGLKAGYVTAAGIATGLTLHAGIAIFFVDVFTSHSSQSILLAVYLLAALYLIWLAYSLLRSAFIGVYSGQKIELSSSLTTHSLTLFGHYRRGLLCNLLNPKVAIFLAGVVLPFRIFAEHSESWYFILWLTIVLEGFVLWCLWVKLLQTQKIKQCYSRNSYIIDGIFGAAVLMLALAIILEMEALVN